MLLKHIMSLYRGEIPEAGRVTPGRLSMKTEILSRLGRAMPFVLTEEALELVVDLSPDGYEEGVILDRLRDFRLPAPVSWFEFEMGTPDDRERIGVLIRGGSGEPFGIIPFLVRGGVLFESFCMLEVDIEKGRVRLAVNTEIFNRYVDQIIVSGADQSREFALQKAEEGKQVFSEVAAMGALYACGATRLMGAKNAPVSGVAEPLMSRQERRALTRKGGDIADTPPALTRIVLNAEGRAHVESMRDGSDGRPRRAH